MESCHSVSRPVATVPPTRLPTYTTLGQLIKIIEKLNTTEDIRTVLKKIVQDCDDASLTSAKKELQLRLDSRSVQRLSEILARLNHSSLVTMATETDGTKNASSATSSGCSERESQHYKVKVAELEMALRALEDSRSSLSQDNSQLIRKLRELEHKCKPLQDKNRKFLEKNMELTTASRNLKDEMKKVNDENKKMKELTEQSKRKVTQLSRQLSQEKMEKGTLELQLEELNNIRQQVAEQNKTITALKQTIVEKDRRMELLQHRKKRRLRNSHDQLSLLSISLEEDRSLDSECSFSSSVSCGTSNDDLLEELSPEEVEKGYRKIMKEQLQLQRSTALLHTHLDCRTDPYRYKKLKTDLETDLFVAQCRIEQLENLLENKEGCDYSWVLEKDQLCTEKQSLQEQVQTLERKLEESQEQVDTMEFQLLEMDDSSLKQSVVPRCDVATETDVELTQYECYTQSAGSLCQREITDLRRSEAALRIHLEMADKVQESYREKLQNLQQQLEGMVQNKGQEGAKVLLELEKAKQYVSQLEQSTQELQTKVSDLQQQNAKIQGKNNEYQLQATLTSEEREELLKVKEKLAAHEAQSQGSCSNRQISSDDLENMTPSKKRRDDIDREAHMSDSGSGSEKHSKEKRSGASKGSGSSRKKSHSDLSREIRKLQSKMKELQEENDVLRYELIENSIAMETSDMETSLPRGDQEFEEELEKMRQKVHQSDVLERQLRDKLKLAENTINDLEASEAVLRDKMDETVKERDKGNKMIVRLQKKTKELKEVILDKEVIENSLQEKMKFLEEAEVISARKVVDLEMSNQVLQQRLDIKEELMSDLHLVETLKEKVIATETENQELKAKIIELEENEEILRDNWKKVADEEANRKDCLEEKIRILENFNKDLKTKLQEKENEEEFIPGPNLALELSSASEDAHNEVVEQLTATVEELQKELKQVTEDSYMRTESLEQEIESMQENEIKFKKAITDMENREKALYSLLGNINNREDSEISSEQYNPEIEQDLNDGLVDIENSYDAKVELCEKEIAELETQENSLLKAIEELANSEKRLKSKLSSALRELQLEKEMTVTLSQRVEDLEKEEKKMRNRFLSRINELEKHEEELMEKVKTFENDSKQASQENSELSRTFKDSDDVKVEVASKLESFVKVEKESDGKLIQPLLENGEDEIASLRKKLEEVMRELSEANDNLQKCSESKLEMSNRIQQFEKENKALSDKLKKQEKKLKKNQRNDNLDDYDSLAREVVTYKNDVEQLRTENNDLHDRVMELDNSESELLKKVESYEEIIDKYEIDLMRLKSVEDRLQIFEDAECKLMDRVCELEEIENRLTEELKKAHENNKTTQIKDIGNRSDENVSEDSSKDTSVDNQVVLHERVKALEKIETELRKELKIAKEKYDSNKLTDRVQNLEKIELKLREELRLVRQNSNSCKQDSLDSDYESGREGVRSGRCDKSVGTSDDESNNSEQKPVSGLFERIQDLETVNQDLTEKLSNLTATDAQVRQLSEKVKLLEQSEDALMERVMELEDGEDRLKRELKRAQSSISSVTDLEQELVALQESGKELEQKVGELEHEKLTLRSSVDFTDKDRADLALRCTSLQKQYEGEKRKVESLLKSEEKLMKSLSSEKKAAKELEKELMSTQEKLEEVQTDYEHKLSEMNETERLLKEELNNQLRERVGLIKKAQECENTTAVVTEEIEACRLSESRMFAQLQDLIAQNEELEKRLAKSGHIHKDDDSLSDVSRFIAEQDTPSSVNHFSMSDNPDIESENPSDDPMSSSIFSEQEQHFLRDPISESSLTGSMPLNMLRKLKDFSEKETKYRTKIEELESENVKLVRKMKILEGKVVDLKSDIQELQIEIFHLRETTSSSDKTVSGVLDDTTDTQTTETSGTSIFVHSKDNLDMTIDDKTEDDNQSSEIFQSEDSNKSFDGVSYEQLILSLKLYEQKELQDRTRISELMDKMATLRVELEELVELVSVEGTIEHFMEQVDNFKKRTEKEDRGKKDKVQQKMLELVQILMSLRQRLEVLQNSETKLRISLAELQIQMEREGQDKKAKIGHLEEKLFQISRSRQRTSSRNSSEGVDVVDTALPGENLDEKNGTKNLGGSEADLWRKLESPVTPQFSADISVISSPARSSPALESDNEREVILLDQNSLKEGSLNLGTGSFSLPVKNDTATLLGTIHTLQNSVQSLKGKVDILESLRDQEGVESMQSAMMDKPEDVLRQRIRELEKLERHLKQQVLDLEKDREELHNIARKDKSIIHDQNVKIRELQLSEKNLKEQLNRYEQNENALYAKVDELEDEVTRLQDRIRELEILEERLKDVVKKYRLDGSILVAKSSNLESSVQEMSAKEETFIQKVQNLETEKSAFSERSEYLYMRVKELENAESDLVQKVKNYENKELSLQNRVSEMEMFVANAQSRVVELEAVNNELTQRLHHSMGDNSSFTQHVAHLQYAASDLEREVLILRDSERRLKHELESLQKREQNLQQSLKEFQIKAVESEGKFHEMEETEMVLKDKLSKLQRNENTLKYRVQELEYNSGQGPVELTAAQKEKLPRKLEDCQRRIIALQVQNSDLQSKLQQYQSVSGNRALVQIPNKEYKLLQAKASLLEQTEYQMDENERLNTHLRQTVQQLREGKEVSGHEVELDVLRKRLEQSNRTVKMLQDHLSDGQWNSQGYQDPRGTQSSIKGLPGKSKSNLLEEGLVQGDGVRIPSPQGYDAQSEGSVEEEVLEKTRTVGAHSRRMDITTAPERSQITRNRAHNLGPGQDDPYRRDTESRQLELNAQRPEALYSRGGDQWINVGKATSIYSTLPGRSHHSKEEELELGLNLLSETDSQVFTQNDTDSSPVSPYRPGRTAVQNYHGSSVNTEAPGLPHTAPPIGHFRTMDSFGESLVMHSGSVLNSEYSDAEREVLLQRGRGHKGGNINNRPSQASAMSVESVVDSGRGTGQVSPGQSIRDRIARIERQLQSRDSDTSSRDINPDTDLTSWKAKVHESNRKLELAEKENKNVKDQINKLERDLESKSRLYIILEAFLSKVEKILMDKNAQNEQELIQRIDNEVSNTRAELVEAGHRPTNISKDLPAVQSELSKKDRELTAKRNEVDALLRELRQWQEECRAIEDMRSNALDSLRGLEMEITDLQHADRQLKQIKDEYNLLRGQIDEMEMSKQKALASVGPLKTRIIHLSQKCNEKDEMIRRLVHELKKLKAGAKPSPLLEELCRIETSGDEDFNHNQINGRRSSSSSLNDSYEHLAYMSDTELTRDRGTRHPQRPRSADYYHHHPRHLPRHNNGSPMHLPHIHRNLTASNSAGPVLTNGHAYMPGSQNGVSSGQQYVAILDYEPGLFSRSGRQRLELPLKEGDQVIVTGPLDQYGYYEAEVNGRVGLVPANYLQPAIQTGGQTPRNRPQSVPQFLDASPERIAQMHSHLQQAHQPFVHGNTMMSSPQQPPLMNGHHSSEMVTELSPVGSREPSRGGTPRQINRQILKGPPNMPEDFHVKKIVSNSSLMLSWRPPALDELGCSNGAKVCGYRIFMNGKIYQQPASPHLAKTVVESVDIHSHHRFGIQTLSAEGQVSELSEIMYEGVEEESSESMTDEGEPETDLRAILDVSAYKTGPKRMFMGIYDYDPSKHSPKDYTEWELSFKAGDVITVFGKERPDGFFHGEVDGKKGLVPASFMEEIPQAPPRSKKAGMKGKKANKDSKSTEEDQKKR